MNSASVPPPPPPPPLQLPTPSCTFKENILTRHLLNNRLTITAEEEVSKAARKVLGRCPQDSAMVSVYKPISAVIQSGPTCGLVALQMAAQALELPMPRMEDILQLGIARGFTVQGEMFSAAQLGAVARELLNCTVQVVSHGLRSNDVFSHLGRGNPILVPYDADFNHEPCCKLGHRAHWATVTGFLKIVNRASSNINLDNLTRDRQLSNLYHADANLKIAVGEEDFAENLYFLAKQGKSNNLGVWGSDALAASNSNLVEIDPHKSDDAARYVIPEGGIADGLRHKILLLSKS